jgi:GT2 family glycosyltransferase
MACIAVLITCHNRREKTLTCLASLYAAVPVGVDIVTYLVDAGSSDGTPVAVSESFPAVRIIAGHAALYWNSGMRLAFAKAIGQGFDFYLWLNDDTRVNTDALHHLVEAYRRGEPTLGKKIIVVGSTTDSGGTKLSYGGWKCGDGVRALNFQRVYPHATQLIECDAMNGNCVLIPHAVVSIMGNLDPTYTHGMGDFDYGLRAKKIGIRAYVAPGFTGICEPNEGAGLWTDGSLTAIVRWRALVGPKGLPPWEWWVFTRRHGGRLWPLYWISPYVKNWACSFR